MRSVESSHLGKRTGRGHSTACAQWSSHTWIRVWAGEERCCEVRRGGQRGAEQSRQHVWGRQGGSIHHATAHALTLNYAPTLPLAYAIPHTKLHAARTG